ncbi:N-acetyltransferase [Weissella diestrammenae]|uniref:N-acetyltransferase n=1 Tax=Weissella diestrammenae TaxID=1162633 RepID=A0A7G9T3S9_9LACO|nr:GNAT family N-acetyltransferase [Weissella diestrammenae]MCM0582738.1 N-acetyltransferase [Weissella diestrammenae]QNN74754.1 N-acetyltransferase [Weissella diestrammenae]
MDFEYEPGRLFHRNETGQVDAEILFPAIENGRVWSIDSTIVAPELRGQGVASQLLAAVIERAQAADVKLRPICSYAKKKFMTTPAYQKLEWHNPD